MMKTWLMRRPVRSPVSLATTAASSSSVWRLPFISSSAWPPRTSATAVAAEAWLCGRVHDLCILPRSMSGGLGDRLDLCRRTDEDGCDQSLSAASDRSGQCCLLARMCNRGRNRLQPTAFLQQTCSYFPSRYSTLRHSVFGECRCVFSARSLSKTSARTMARATPYKQRSKCSLIVFERRCAPSTRNRLHNPSENRTYQSTEGEVEEVHDTRCGTAQVGRVRLLDHGVGDHRRTGCDSGDKPENIRRKRIRATVEDPAEASRSTIPPPTITGFLRPIRSEMKPTRGQPKIQPNGTLTTG